MQERYSSRLRGLICVKLQTFSMVSDGEIDAHHARSSRIDEGIKIRLNISREPDSNADEPLLCRWLNRVGDDAKKGTSLKMSYYLASLSYPLELMSNWAGPKKILSWIGTRVQALPMRDQGVRQGRSKKAF